MDREQMIETGARAIARRYSGEWDDLTATTRGYYRLHAAAVVDAIHPNAGETCPECGSPDRTMCGADGPDELHPLDPDECCDHDWHRSARITVGSISKGWHWHIGRAWVGHQIEDECPCPQEPCGLIDTSRIDPSCVQHNPNKTIRQGHNAEDCPGPAGVPPSPQPEPEHMEGIRLLAVSHTRRGTTRDAFVLLCMAAGQGLTADEYGQAYDEALAAPSPLPADEPEAACNGNVCVDCTRCEECGRRVGTRHLDTCACPEGAPHWYCPDCNTHRVATIFTPGYVRPEDDEWPARRDALPDLPASLPVVPDEPEAT